MLKWDLLLGFDGYEWRKDGVVMTVQYQIHTLQLSMDNMMPES